MGFEQFDTMFLVHDDRGKWLEASSAATAKATRATTLTSATATAHTKATLTSATTAKDVQAIDEVNHTIAGNGVLLGITTHGSGDGTADGALLVQDIVQLE